LIIESNDLGRLLAIYVAQLVLSAIFLILAYKILKRNINRLTIILSGFYISSALAFILNAIYLPIRLNPIVYVLYFTAAYLILFSPIFLVLFNINLLKLDTEFTLKKQYIIIFSYGIAVFILLNYPGGITINEGTNWTPDLSWDFLIIIYIFGLCVIVLPFILLFLKLYKKFEDKKLKKKLMVFFIGFCGILFTFYGMILSNTWDEPIFKSIWNILALFILIPSGFLIYYAWGRQI